MKRSKLTNLPLNFINKKSWKNFEEKYKEITNIDLNNFEQLENAVKNNGLDSNINYNYLKALKIKNKIKKFKKEFNQYKFTLSTQDRLSLSEKEKIKTNLKIYIEKLLMKILNKIKKNEKKNEIKTFNFKKEIKKFKIDFKRFGFLINKNNTEIYYAFLIKKILFELNLIQDTCVEDFYFIMKRLNDFIKSKNITENKLLVFYFLLNEINLIETENYYEVRRYSEILKDSKDENEKCLINIGGFNYEINKQYFELKNIHFYGKRNKINELFKHQRIIEDNKIFIDNSYYGKDFYIIYNFFQKVIRSKILNYIYSNIDGFKDYLKEEIFKEINIEKLIFIPMFMSYTTYGFNQNYFEYTLIDSLPKSTMKNFYDEKEEKNIEIIKNEEEKEKEEKENEKKEEEEEE